MRFDEIFTFLDCQTGMVQSSEQSRPICQNGEVNGVDVLLAKFSVLASQDWRKTYVVLPMKHDYQEQLKDALVKFRFRENMQPPAIMHAWLYCTDRKIMPLIQRKLILGTVEDVLTAVKASRSRDPRTLLFGMHNLDVMGYRNISDIPKERAALCLRGLFVGVVIVSELHQQDREWVNEAILAGLEIEDNAIWKCQA